MGLDPDAFWSKTPREVSIIVTARVSRETRRFNDLMWQAWHIAAFGRMKKMPSLKSVMLKKPSKRQGWQEQMAAMDAYATRVNKKVM